MWDYGTHYWRHSPRLLDYERRLVPVPFARPTAPGAYNALPAPASDPRAGRARFRAHAGLDPDVPLVFTTTATWQLPKLQWDPYNRMLAQRFPEVIGELLRRLDPRVHVLHTGPTPLSPVADALGPRYHHHAQVTPRVFEDMMVASDLVVTFNASASTTNLALANAVPVIVGATACAGEHPDEILAGLRFEPEPEISAWIRSTPRLSPFLVWPYGFDAFLTPVLADNPLCEVVARFEALDVAAFPTLAEPLIFDEETRAAWTETRDAYVTEVERLPTAPQRIDAYLG